MSTTAIAHRSSTAPPTPEWFIPPARPPGNFMQRHPVLAFYVLAFTISWAGILLVIGGPANFPGTAVQVEKLFLSVMVAWLAGPSIASIVLTGLVDGKAGYRELVARLLRWRAGARWYACQVMETTQLTTTNVVQRTGSLKDSLANATTPLIHRCTNVIGLKDDDWDDMVGIDCGQPHDAEFAGAFKVPGTAFPQTEAQFESILDECWNVVARFAGAKVDDIQMGYIPWGLVEKDWNRGHRYVRCFAWSDKKKTTGSMKGIGGKAPA